MRPDDKPTCKESVATFKYLQEKACKATLFPTPGKKLATKFPCLEELRNARNASIECLKNEEKERAKFRNKR